MLHMVLADRIAGALSHPTVDGARGPFLLGATTPDIRVLTRQDRFSTHFFDLGTHEHQDSVGAFFGAHEHLAQPDTLSAETASFVSGYVSHLVMDEQYITTMYRAHFLDRERGAGSVRANVQDRLLQFDMERRHAGDPELRHAIIETLAFTAGGIEIGFIDTDTLERWRALTADLAARDLDWERARAMIANHLRHANLEEGETITTFLDSLPGLLEETIAHITDAEVEGFVDRCTEAAGRAVERYLGCE